MIAVLYVLAIIGAVTMVLLLWKAFGPERGAGPDERALAPDDDPDFLRELGRRQRPDSNGSA
ncbi:MAG: hypothetical protein GEU83_04530 [Pseudonocardiaceae bacterium]|nr:hypothetical protein [Pseudonocardiaceae bacterium]